MRQKKQTQTYKSHFHCLVDVLIIFLLRSCPNINSFQSGIFTKLDGTDKQLEKHFFTRVLKDSNQMNLLSL